MVPFAVLVVAVAMLLSWEWGRLVHGSEADIVHRGTPGRGGVARRRWQPSDMSASGSWRLPIGAILATLLSLGRNSLFSALGVFYAGLPAVAIIWLRSDRHAWAAGRHVRDRRRHRLRTRPASSAAGCWAARSCGRASRPTRPGQA